MIPRTDYYFELRNLLQKKQYGATRQTFISMKSANYSKMGQICK